MIVTAKNLLKNGLELLDVIGDEQGAEQIRDLEAHLDPDDREHNIYLRNMQLAAVGVLVSVQRDKFLDLLADANDMDGTRNAIAMNIKAIDFMRTLKIFLKKGMEEE